jgi:cysteine desulfurase
MTKPIYLDYNATTPCDPRVVEAMLPYFTEIYGNPANGFHVLGRKAAQAVENARQQVASLVDAQPFEIIFTSGATESNHLAILVSATFAPVERRKVITCSIEHKAVLAPCKKLEQQGFEVVVLPVDKNGVVSLADLENALDSNTFLVSIQAANNEIGTLQSIESITDLAHSYGALVHTDAAQAAGKIPCSVLKWKIDLLSLSAHKMYGPKGIGALYIRGGKKLIPLQPLILGGGQEKGLRSGTSNVPAIVGFGTACEIAAMEMPDEQRRLQALRDELEQELQRVVPMIKINAQGAPRLPNTINFTIEGVEADSLLLRLPSLMMSVGSACASGAPEPSHVLQAIGLTRDQARCSARISLGRMNSSADIPFIVHQIKDAVKSLL